MYLTTDFSTNHSLLICIGFCSLFSNLQPQGLCLIYAFSVFLSSSYRIKHLVAILFINSTDNNYGLVMCKVILGTVNALISTPEFKIHAQ